MDERETRLDHLRNEDIRKEAHVKLVETFLENKRLKWFGRDFFTCDLPVRPSFRLSDGHEGQEVVSNF